MQKSRQVSDGLFLLIKSLNKNEKRYFKRFAQRSTDKKDQDYLMLFNVIEKQKVFNESILKKSVLAKHLPGLKNYLYNVILKSLDENHSEKSIDVTLRKFMSYIEILYEKGLYDLSLKFLYDAKEKACKFERYHITLLLLRIEIKILQTTLYLKEIEKKSDEFLKEEKNILKVIDNINEFSHLYSKLYSYFRQSGSKSVSNDEVFAEKINLIQKHPLLSDEKKALSSYSKIFFFNIHSLLGELRNDPSQLYLYSRKLVQFLEKTPHLLAEELERYVIAMNNLLTGCVHYRKKEEFNECISKMRNIPSLWKSRCTENIRVRIFARSYIAELSWQVSYGQINEALKTITEVEKGLLQYKGKINKANEMLLYYYATYALFGAKDYSGALKWLNLIINDKEKIISQDTFVMARILWLIVHYEMQNEDLLKYVVKSTDRFLKKRKGFYRVENFIIKFIEKSIIQGTVDRVYVVNSFYKLRNNVSEALKDSHEVDMINRFDIIAWIDSKIENRDFSSLLVQRAKIPLSELFSKAL